MFRSTVKKDICRCAYFEIIGKGAVHIRGQRTAFFWGPILIAENAVFKRTNHCYLWYFLTPPFNNENQTTVTVTVEVSLWWSLTISRVGIANLQMCAKLIQYILFVGEKIIIILYKYIILYYIIYIILYYISILKKCWTPGEPFHKKITRRK